MEYVIDSELLILAIEKRPLIWDQHHEFYKHRDKRREAWIEICEIFFDDLDTKEEVEKVFISKQVETKWRHIRDNFTRDLREKVKSGGTSRAKTKRKYIYADQLEFLRASIEQKFRTDCAGGGEERGEGGVASDAGADSDEPAAVVREQRRADRRPLAKAHRSKQSTKTLPFEESMIQMELPMAAATVDDSDDMAFFRSLAPMLAPLSTQQKMKFRIDVMQQLVKYHDDAAPSSTMKFDFN